MRALLSCALLLAASCASLPDGSEAVSLERAREVVSGLADDVALADLNGDGMLQIDSNSGVPLAALQDFLRSNSDALLSNDRNGDGMLDSHELLGAAPFFAGRLFAARDSLQLQDADGSLAELGMFGLLLAERLQGALAPAS